MNTTFWLKPSVKPEGIQLLLGEHTFTYVAIDAFKNKAKCNFTITVIDITPPTIDNCFDPTPFQLPFCTDTTRYDCFVEWEDPIIYDNSNTDVFVNQTISPGYLSVGVHPLQYTAIDVFGNHNECQMNITVKRLECDVLQSPLNGQTLCAKNQTHTWCDVTCNFGHAIYDDIAESYLDNFKMFCENNFPKWKFEIIPDCTAVELPTEIEHVFSIALESEHSICGDTSTKNKVILVYKYTVKQK